MKIKNKFAYFLTAFLIFGGMFFLNFNKAIAGCCVVNSNTGIVCSTNTSGCPVAVRSEECAVISECYEQTNNPSPGAPVEFINPLGDIKTISQLLDSLLNNLMGIIAVVAVIFIVIGGIMYMMSGGNEAMVTRAKKTWTGAVIGLAIALAAPTFLKEIQAILGGTGGTGGSAATWYASGLTIKQIAVNILDFLLSLVGIFAIISMVIGGGMYLTAYGDEKRIDSGKKIITYALIGIVVSLASLVIIRQVDKILRGGNDSISKDYKNQRLLDESMKDEEINPFSENYNPDSPSYDDKSYEPDAPDASSTPASNNNPGFDPSGL